MKNNRITPRSRDDILNAVLTHWDEFRFLPEFHDVERILEVTRAAANILHVLPDMVSSMTVVRNLCSQPARDFIRAKTAEWNIDRSVLENILLEFCVKISFIFYERSIVDFVNVFNSYAAKRSPPRQWNLNSLKELRNLPKSGYAFHAFWRSHFDASGDHFFVQFVLPNIHQNWRATYQRINRNISR